MRQTPEEWVGTRAGCEIMTYYQSARSICMKSLIRAVFFFWHLRVRTRRAWTLLRLSEDSDFALLF
jgi:hypothetical protein